VANPPEDVNADTARRALVHSAHRQWQESPSGTVLRKPFYRHGGEFGPVTGLVRYQPGGRFAAHGHPAGEEILVLEGVFSDEHGDYPVGTYLFNPDGFSHAPRSGPGCLLFVRLRQYPGVRRRRVTRVASVRTFQLPGGGIHYRWLYRDPGFDERVVLLELSAGASLPERPAAPGEELLVLSGSAASPTADYPQGTWVREAGPVAPCLRSAGGCLLYLKSTGSALEPLLAGAVPADARVPYLGSPGIWNL
jgi:anti-sigma factor ChrR (cupin superfamily)